jgi:protoporphyrinogen oxidase
MLKLPQGARVAVVGAGIAGMTAAYRLAQAGHNPVVLEAADYVGGRIRSVRRGDFLFDIGAFIYLGSYGESVALMREVGLGDQIQKFHAFGAMPREGRLNYLDFSKPLRTILRTQYISGAAKLKLLKLIWLLIKNWKYLNYDDAAGIAGVDGDSVKSYADPELSPELLDYITSVVVRGPWLIDPERASVAQLLWTMKNFFKPYFYGLDTGMDALPRALGAGLDVWLGCKVMNVIDDGAQAELTWETDGKRITEAFDACILTTTTNVTLQVFPQVSGFIREFFETTEYISSVNTHIALKSRPANPATYIMASPREQLDFCGVIVDHLKAGFRAPADKGMITVFCRDAWCKANMAAPDAQVLREVLGFLKPY